MNASIILIQGAREHNLRDIDLELPRQQLIVFTGVSGSGKSSLAFDTLYAEGQRRYIESLSSYARQFLGQMQKPHYRTLKGLPPTIAISQGTHSVNPRSTVGTITEILDYLRVLYARVGEQHCHNCGAIIHRLSAQEIVRQAVTLPEGGRFLLLAPLESVQGGQVQALLHKIRSEGFVRIRLDGTPCSLEELPPIDARRSHQIDIVVDRLVQKKGQQQRITDSVETALRVGKGRCIILTGEGSETQFTERLECPSCRTPVPELSPQLFSFNHPKGMCPACEGLGTQLEPDPDKVVPNPELSLSQGAIQPWARIFERKEGAVWEMYHAALEALEINTEIPYRELPEAHRHLLLYGAGDQKFEASWKSRRGLSQIETEFEGVVPTLLRRMRETKSDEMRRYYLDYLSQRACTECRGQRLRKEALAVHLSGHSMADLADLSLRQCQSVTETLSLSGTQGVIASELLKEINSRLSLLMALGLDYLTLSRSGPSLSGGEAQRIRLAGQVGSELTGVLYVLDEPSIGLHPRDTDRLINTLFRLRDLGNSVVVVEHDPNTILAADHVVDFGPGAGKAGGEVLYTGSVEGLKQVERSLTGAWLSGRKKLPIPLRRRPSSKQVLTVKRATHHNLKGLTVSLPLKQFIVITGVSGAGKSSLVNDILFPALSNALHRSRLPVGAHETILGLEHIDKVIHIDQGPIGRSPKSTPATYVKLFDLIRSLYAQLPEAKVRGYSENRFSYNVKGGRCEACEGEGARTIAMHFLPDVYVPCEVCHGRRYNEATLEITFRGHSIADVLEKTVAEVYEIFHSHDKIAKILSTLLEVGLGYLSLGQSATTLSGGEAQRLKLSRELARPDTGRTLYLLDEPTTGLHMEDVSKLVAILQRLVDAGNTVLVIEHNAELMCCADTIVDLGPEGGEAGGDLVAIGTPEEVARVPHSYTGQALSALLGR